MCRRMGSDAGERDRVDVLRSCGALKGCAFGLDLHFFRPKMMHFSSKSAADVSIFLRLCMRERACEGMWFLYRTDNQLLATARASR